ncbi:MAG: cytochrome b/b6 domain-containing protein [Sulfurospirillaceae bacterium]|nr:cytochrome b/b6 domain-containing protein [Sulfurospirillaceae bacterium]
MGKKVYVWSKATRYFHWILAPMVAVALISGEFKNAFLIHLSVGIALGGLLTFRLIWGFIGPTHALFKNFNFHLHDLLYYLFMLFKDRKTFVGHNPAASWATIFLIVFGFICTLSGIMLLGAQEGRGIFSHLYPSTAENLRWVHIWSKDIVLVVAIIHVIGALLEHFWHKTQIISSMIHGYKNVDAPDIKPTKFQEYFGFFSLAFSICLGFYTLIFPQGFMSNNKDAILYSHDNPNYAKECSECHNLMPTILLPKHSWHVVLSDPKDHFKEDLTKKVPHLASIKSYILDNSAETSSDKVAMGVLKTTEGKNIYRVTKTKYWKDIHSQIPRSAYKHPNIKRESNCSACHQNFGLTNYINLEDIKLTHFSNWDAIKIYLKMMKPEEE